MSKLIYVAAVLLLAGIALAQSPDPPCPPHVVCGKSTIQPTHPVPPQKPAPKK